MRAAAIAAEIFAPLIPAIITGGLILGFRNCIDQLYLFENGTKTLVELSQFWAGVDHFLWLIGEAVFHVGIPVGICRSVVRKMGGIPGILSMQPQTMPTFAMAMMVAIAVPFVLTVIVGKKKGIDKQARPEAAETVAAEENVTGSAMESEHDFTAFLDGEVISLKEVGDGVFSEGIVGEGLAVRPISETLCAPVSDKITMLMEDSRHAVGMTLSNGVEILLHVGMVSAFARCKSAGFGLDESKRAGRTRQCGAVLEGAGRGRIAPFWSRAQRRRIP